MATWNNATWNSGALWGPATPQPPATTNTNKRKTNTMKRQRYFPATVAARPEWFGHLAAQLPVAKAELGLPSAEVTAIVADARFCEYVTGAWITAAREFGPAATAAIEELYDGSGASPFVLPAFTAPALPAGVTAVPPGALQRIFTFVQAIKSRPGYNENIGQQLGMHIGIVDLLGMVPVEVHRVIVRVVQRVVPGHTAARQDGCSKHRPRERSRPRQLTAGAQDWAENVVQAGQSHNRQWV